MRTTLAIDDDLAMLLHRRARERQRPFKEIVNEALRRGLVDPVAPAPVQVPQPHSLGAPKVDLTRALRMADDLDDARDRS